MRYLSKLPINTTNTREWLLEVWIIFWTLTKIMLPMLIIVRVIELMGWVEVLAQGIEPLMQWVGLPGEMGLVWVSAMVSSIYTGMAVFYQLGGAEQLTVAQISVLGTLILIAHSLPVEVAIAKSTGVSIWFTLALRVGGALVLGLILHLTYSYTGSLQYYTSLSWQPAIGDDSWHYWLILQGQTFLAAFIIIAALTLLMRVMRYLGIEKIIHWLLAPIMRAMGIGAKAINIMIAGLTLGIALGGGLMIQEARSGHISGKDIFMTMAFLGLCHSLIEDTLLIVLLGADLSAILWGRLVFSLLFIALLARILNWLPQKQHRTLFTCPMATTKVDS